MSKERLEEIYQERENGLKIIIELIKEDKEKLNQQNKRYRKYLKKITNKAFIQDYCDKHDIYEYEAMYDLANEALEELE